ncbi:hypothetical protein [Paracoccus sp. DMF]|nr:hypothetical protein [Paracoccus sp. DMF]
MAVVLRGQGAEAIGQRAAIPTSAGSVVILPCSIAIPFIKNDNNSRN